MPEKPSIEVVPRAGIGYGCSEAPRGICVHRYKIDDNGNILDAKIVPPTSQNQKTIESDLRQLVSRNISLSDAKLTWLCEQAVRNYDPCISCATHFLKLNIERE
jgi:coenzyme F420-reducing hydrogenase alpha subunit